MASIFDDLGAMFSSPQQLSAPAADRADIKSQWDGWMSNPANRAALLGFGVQALAGGGGSFNQQLASALGNGMASAQGYEQLSHQRDVEEQDRDFKERQLSSTNSRADAQLASTERIHAADRASREKIANIYADQRMTTAGMRADLHPLIQQEWNKVYSATLNDIMLMGKTEEERMALAKSRADAAANAFQARFNAPGAPGGAPGTSANPANGGAPGGNPPVNIPQISPGSSVAPTTGTKPTLQQLLTDPRYSAKVQAALQNPAARAVLRGKIADPQSLNAYEQQTTPDPHWDGFLGGAYP